ncbi:MAG TPA: hypothetical protein VNX88_14290 [Terriglobales bacterium]|nr:hypothetical protein [Terriglobales bacterium]
MKKFKSSISKSMERAAIRVAPSGKAATKVFAALLVLELAAGTIGCSKSKPVAQNAQNSSNQIVATAPVAAVPSVAPVPVSQPETAKKKSVQGPVRKLPRTLLYTDADSGFSLAYPRKSSLKTGQRAELEAIGIEWLPMNFVQQGGTTVTMLELPSNTKEQKGSSEFFAVSVHNGLTAEQCGKFAGESASKLDNSTAEKADAMSISRVSLHGFEYSELNRQTDQGNAKYYHRFVPGSGEISSCYEFTLAVKSGEKKAEGENIVVSSDAKSTQVQKKDDFARLEKILASVKIKAESEPAKVAAEASSKTNGNNNEQAETAKTMAKGDENPR